MKNFISNILSHSSFKLGFSQLTNQRIFLLFTIVLLTAYSNSFTNDFVYDDLQLVVFNRHIKNLTNIPSFFTDLGAQSEPIKFAHYRPLTTLSYALNYALGGLDPIGYHLTNFVFHLLNVFLVFWLIRSITQNELLAFATALLWGLHPIQTEAVSWITSRSNVMSTTFYLASILAYRHWLKPTTNKLWLIIVVIAYMGGLFSKEMAIMLPLTLIFLDLLIDRPNKTLRQNLWVYGLLLAVGGIYWLIRLKVIGYFSMSNPWSDNPWTIFSTMMCVMGRYASLLLWPWEQRVAYEFPLTSSLLRFDVVIIFTSILACLVLIFYLHEKQPTLSLALGWFYIHILPVSNIIPFQVVIAERFLYVPSIGFALLIAYLISRLSLWSTKAFYFVLVVICISYGVLTFKQNKIWKNEGTLFSQVIKYEPNSASTHFALGTYYLFQDNNNLAEKELEKAIELNPNNEEFYNNLGIVYKKQKKYKQAILVLQMAIEINSKFANAYINLASVYNTQNNFKKQIATLEKLSQLTPFNPEVYDKLIIASLNQGDKTKAKQYYEILEKLEPDHPRSLYLKNLLF